MRITMGNRVSNKEKEMSSLSESMEALSLKEVGRELLCSQMSQQEGSGTVKTEDSKQAGIMRQDCDEAKDGNMQSQDYYEDTQVGQSAFVGTIPGGSNGIVRRARGDWSEEQDDALRMAVERHGGKNWKAIAMEVPGNRTHIQCLQRWGKVLKPGLIKGPWTDEEDELLRTYVPLEAKNNWVAVAEHVPGRTAKQCRERWSLSLDPNIRKDPWTSEEDELLLQLHEQHGNAWAVIVKHLNGRTVNAAKSRFKSIERKRYREWTPHEDLTIIKGKTDDKRWSLIADMLPSARSKHAIKTRWKELVETNPDMSQTVPLATIPQGGPSNAPPPISYQLDRTLVAEPPQQHEISQDSKALRPSLSSDMILSVSNPNMEQKESFDDWLKNQANQLQNATSTSTTSIPSRLWNSHQLSFGSSGDLNDSWNGWGLEAGELLSLELSDMELV